MAENAKKTSPKKAAAATPEPERHPEDDLSYEEAREQLVEVVGSLEQGGTSLAASVELWERGERLARTCQRWLDGARERLDAAIERDEEESSGS